MRVNREFSDPDLAGFLQTADEAAIRLALAGNEQEKRDALRAALDAGAASGMVDARGAFSRLLTKYRRRT
jgi:DNA-binding transcriptional regulator LsrR (DeoR family)